MIFLIWKTPFDGAELARARAGSAKTLNVRIE